MSLSQATLFETNSVEVGSCPFLTTDSRSVIKKKTFDCNKYLQRRFSAAKYENHSSQNPQELNRKSVLNRSVGIFYRSVTVKEFMMKMKSGFRNTQWDPLLLIAQIVAIQSVLYFTLAFIIGVMDFFVEANHTLDHLFQYHEIHVTDSGGRSVIFSFVLNAIIGALSLRFIVGRTKLCLDFSCTYHFIHLFVCWIYNGAFPSTFSWWFLNAACATLMCVLGEFLCLKIELKEIPVGYAPLDTKADL